MPFEACYRLLHSQGFDDYCTLEWEKRWHPEIEEPEIAFPDFVRFMKRLEEKCGANLKPKKRL